MIQTTNDIASVDNCFLCKLFMYCLHKCIPGSRIHKTHILLERDQQILKFLVNQKASYSMMDILSVFPKLTTEKAQCSLYALKDIGLVEFSDITFTRLSNIEHHGLPYQLPSEFVRRLWLPTPEGRRVVNGWKLLE